MKTPRPESERAAAARLKEALKINVTRASVRRLMAKGIDLQDVDAVRHAFAMQERKPSPIGLSVTAQPKPQPAAQPKPADQSAPPDDADQRRPLSSDELDARLAGLEHELLMAPNYETGRSIRIKISGYRELVRVQKDRGDLVDRKQVEGEAYQFGNLVKTMLLQLPGRLIPQIVGLDYPEAFEKAEEWVYSLLAEIYETGRDHIIPVDESILSRPVSNPETNATENETEP